MRGGLRFRGPVWEEPAGLPSQAPTLGGYATRSWGPGGLLATYGHNRLNSPVTRDLEKPVKTEQWCGLGGHDIEE